jgi:hypothetical protein
MLAGLGKALQAFQASSLMQQASWHPAVSIAAAAGNPSTCVQGCHVCQHYCHIQHCFKGTLHKVIPVGVMLAKPPALYEVSAVFAN